MGVLRYTGPIPLKSHGGNHKPSIWYIADKERYLDSIFAIDRPNGFAPYDYAFTREGKPLYSYFSIARYDLRNYGKLSVQVGKSEAKFYTSILKGKLPENLNRTIEEFRMLYCDYLPAGEEAGNITHVLIFPTNRGFFHLSGNELTIIGVYYGIDLDYDANTYSIFINGDLHSGPFDMEDPSGFDWLEESIYRNIGEWRRNNGIR